MATPDAADPWSWDAFGDSVPKVEAPAPFKPKARLFPDEDRLFKVQEDALRTVNELRELERQMRRGKQSSLRAGPVRPLFDEDGERVTAAQHTAAADGLERQLKRAIDAAEDTYRVIRSYLDKYVSPSL